MARRPHYGRDKYLDYDTWLVHKHLHNLMYLTDALLQT